MAVSTQDKIKLGFRCPTCDGTKLELPDDYTDDSMARCANPDCRTSFGRWGDIRQAAVQKAKDVVRRQVKTSLKKSFSKFM